MIIKITSDQALSRWDTIPQKLRSVIASDITNDILQQACAAERIPETLIPGIARLVGFVLLGFIHPGDLAKEFQDELGMNAGTANGLAGSLGAKIFTSIRADLDKVYAPVPRDEEGERDEEEKGPKIIQDIAPQTAKPVIGGVAPDQKLTSSIIKNPAPASQATLQNKSAQAQSAPQPIQPTNKKLPAPAFTPASSSGPTSTPAPVAKAAPAPTPIIIQQSSMPTPLKKAIDFHLAKPGLADGDTGMNFKKAGPPPVKPAILEFGKAFSPGPVPIPKPATPPVPTPPKPSMPPAPATASAPKAAPGGKPEERKSSMVHYSELVENSGARKITEVTEAGPAGNPARLSAMPPKPSPAPASASASEKPKILEMNQSMPTPPPKTISSLPPQPTQPPMPPAPLKPSAPPMPGTPSVPPSPPSPPKKVIVKDFLGPEAGTGKETNEKK